MGTVHAIDGGKVPAAGEPDNDLVSLLENLIERARLGQIQSLVATGRTADGARWSAFGGSLGDDVYAMRGAIAWLEDEYVARITAAM